MWRRNFFGLNLHTTLAKCCSFILVASLSYSANSYEPQAHEILTLNALDLYQRCYPAEKLFTDKKIQQRVVQGNRAMDEGLDIGFWQHLFLRDEDNLSLEKRIFNWHFYHPQSKNPSKVGLIEQSMQELWRGVKQGISANDDEFDKVLFVGALIHLLEDTSVPAHVVPVYHGPVAIKSLGPNRLAPLVNYMLDVGEFDYLEGNPTVLMIYDSIDHWLPDRERFKASLVEEKDCADIEMGSQNTVDVIREQQAEMTLQQLTEFIPHCSGFTWQHFWLSPRGKSYFGRYNVEMNQPLFGQAGRLINGVAVCDFVEHDERYSDFVFKLHREAIISDASLLRAAFLAFNELKNEAFLEEKEYS